MSTTRRASPGRATHPHVVAVRIISGLPAMIALPIMSTLLALFARAGTENHSSLACSPLLALAERNAAARAGASSTTERASPGRGTQPCVIGPRIKSTPLALSSGWFKKYRRARYCNAGKHLVHNARRVDRTRHAPGCDCSPSHSVRNAAGCDCTAKHINIACFALRTQTEGYTTTRASALFTLRRKGPPRDTQRGAMARRMLSKLLAFLSRADD